MRAKKYGKRYQIVTKGTKGPGYGADRLRDLESEIRALHSAHDTKEVLDTKWNRRLSLTEALEVAR